MVILEVAQACMSAWPPPANASNRYPESQGLYLEVYSKSQVKTRDPHCCSCFSTCYRKRTSSEVHSCVNTTPLVPEERKMLWRKYNEDDFLVALFTLGDDCWPVQRGDQLEIVADVLRQPLDPQQKGSKVLTLAGLYKVGFWGPVHLTEQGMPTPENVEEENLSTPMLTLEFRPISTRPFTLEFARPRQVSEDVDTLQLRVLMKKIRQSSEQGERREIRRPSQVGLIRWGNSKPVSTEGFAREVSPIMSDWTPAWSCSQPLSEESSDTSSTSPSPHRAPKGRKANNQWQNFGPMQSLRSTLSSKSMDSSTCHYGQKSLTECGTISCSNASAEVASFYHANTAANASLAAMMGARPFSSHASLRRSPAKAQGRQRGEVNEWVPTDWARIWKSSWPGNNDDLGARVQVVPLMEQEFKRDCIVLFNTLFPSVAGERFALMRDLAFDPSSKIRFKPVTKTLNRMSSFSALSHMGEGAPINEDLFPRGLKRNSLRSLSSWSSMSMSSFSSADFVNSRSSSDTNHEKVEKKGMWNRWHAASLRLRKCLKGAAKSAGSTSADMCETGSITSGESCLMCESTLTETDFLDPATEIDALSSTSSAAPTELSVAHESNGSAGSTECPGGECSPSSPGGNGDYLPADKMTGEQQEPVRQTSRDIARQRSCSTDSLDSSLEYDLASTCSTEDSLASNSISKQVLQSKSTSNDISPAYCSKATISQSISSTLFASSSHLRASGRLDALSLHTDKDKSSHQRGSLRIVSTEQGNFYDDYSQRILFMKRLLVCYAFCGVFYSEAANSEQLGELWHYPIAAILGHGSRVLIRLEDVEATEFLNFLLLGDPHGFDWREGGVPAPLKPRIAATHSATLECETGNVVEKKLKVNASDTMQNLADGIRKKHLGLNVPIGGVGNPSPLGRNCFIDYQGRVVRQGKSTSASAMVKTVSDKLNKGMSRASSILSKDDKKKCCEAAEAELSAEQKDVDVVERQSSTCSSKATAEHKDLGSWRQIPNLQSGHLYIRVDDYGKHAGSWGGFQGDFRTSRAEEMKTFLRRKPNENTLPLEQANLRMQVDRHANEAGELLFQEAVPRIKMPQKATSLGSVGQRIIRVNSMPNLEQKNGNTSEDVRWANQWIMAVPGAKLPLKPPSQGALQMLLEHHDPFSVQLYGKGHFKCMDEFYEELQTLNSFLVIRGNAVQRCLESVVLELCWQGHVLMFIKEEGQATSQVEKRELPKVRMKPYEHWQKVATCLAVQELGLPEELFVDSLVSTDDKTHRVVEETAMSSSFPGMSNLRRTHIVRWEISDHSIEFYKAHGLGVDLEEKARSPHQREFSTERQGVTCIWQWVPQEEVGNYKAQSYNFGQTREDDAWVKYAIHKDGIVQFPPTEVALTVLLRRTGIDISKFGVGPCKTLHDLWVELLNQSSYLQMNRGKPKRVLEGVLVRVRMQMPKQQLDSSRPWRVLVRRDVSVEDKHSQAMMKLMRTSKMKEETWEDAALRCVMEELKFTKSKLKGAIIPSQPASEYKYIEEVRQSTHFPGMKTVYRYHLVTYTVAEDILRLPEVSKYLQRSDSVETTDPTSSPTSSRWFSPQNMKDPSSPWKKTRPEYTWIEERDAKKEVKDLSYWVHAKKGDVAHHVSSVLIGLEGAAPNCNSPFGSVHDIKGASNKVSALGNRKWRAYRSNNALQIPSTEGGMRMKINREMFQELIDACTDIGLLDPSSDLLMKPHQGFPRSFLDQRHAEKEFFKQILGGSGRQARSSVEWMRKYCTAHRFPDQAYAAMYRQKRKTSKH